MTPFLRTLFVIVSLCIMTSACAPLSELYNTSMQTHTPPAPKAQAAPKAPSPQQSSVAPAGQISVYVLPDGKVVNWAAPGASRRQLPTKDYYMESDGCYIACYSHNTYRSVYSVGGDINVMGQIRVKGRYYGRVCHPNRFVGKDISAEKYFTTLCELMLPSRCARQSCWAGGDTGGFFGIQ